ncbi:MAG: hypothetical protein DMF06_09815 [Verrucomicrobia bacterium]|nr:MAG: hypothetical protein DMF06_09815 [Verrucomicrobiota bacterium]
MKTLAALFVIALAFFAYFYFHRPISYPPGVLIDSEPTQIAIGDGEQEIEHGRYHLKPLARFKLDARILHRKTYGYDRGAKLVPVDLAVGWGAMSDQAVLDRLTISQSMRFYWYEYQSPPIPKDQIISHSTNLHVIPASPAIAAFCKSLRQGELVHLEGELVEATGPEIGTWRSSLTRTDSGNGACELMLVENCAKLDPAVRKATALVTR